MFAPNFLTNCPYWLYIWIWCVGDLNKVSLNVSFQICLLIKIFDDNMWCQYGCSPTMCQHNTFFGKYVFTRRGYFVRFVWRVCTNDDTGKSLSRYSESNSVFCRPNQPDQASKPTAYSTDTIPRTECTHVILSSAKEDQNCQVALYI